MSFESFELDQALIDAIADLGWKKPTSIQQEVIPQALNQTDIMASAPTGTGKTAAFLLPSLQYLLDVPRRKPGSARLLIVTPTRELAVQIADDAKALAKYTSLSVISIIGGISYDEHEAMLEKNVDVLVATPGRLLEYVRQEAFDGREVEMLVIDEADRMLDMGFFEAMTDVAQATHWRKQTLLFSATLEGRGLERFAQELLSDPVTIHADASRRERGKILQYYYYCDHAEHKLQLLLKLLADGGKSIVFVKTRERLMELKARLDGAGIKSVYLRGEMEQARRDFGINAFRENKVQVLLATDVAARGLDIDDIQTVINYDMPRSADVYVHRIGRTARAGRKGTAINLVEAHDLEMLHKVQRYSGDVIKRRVVEDLKPQTKQPDVMKMRAAKRTAKKAKAAKQNTDDSKKKIRHREQKNIGKRRKPSEKTSEQ